MAAAGLMAAPALMQRGTAMLERVVAEAGAVVPASQLPRVRDALAAALAARDGAVTDDHDPRYLHPARTLRILIADAGCTDPAALAAAAFVDSVDSGLVPAWQPWLDPQAATLLREVPGMAPSDTLLERLVSAPPAALTVAVAERLDQARHLHLRAELDWRTFHQDVLDAWVPAAARAAPLLAHRLHRWADAFTRRLLRPR